MNTDGALEYASTLYGFEPGRVTDINSGSNKVYNVRKEGRHYYLRISARELGYIKAEIDWINYLNNNTSVRVPVLVQSVHGNYIETYENNGSIYVLCMFCQLEGVFWDKNNIDIWNEAVFYNWGGAMGQMHRAAKGYRPPEGAQKRPSFEDRLVPLDLYQKLPAVREKMRAIEAEIPALPKDTDSYGLIHSDMHQQNMLIRGNTVGVLDFDDCQYGFFALDIGIALYHAIWWGLPDENGLKNDFASMIIKNFMSGYCAENQLSGFWRKKILTFMLYRQIDALSWHLGYYKPTDMDVTVYNDCFKIYYSFAENIKSIENDIFYENCAIGENWFINAVK